MSADVGAPSHDYLDLWSYDGTLDRIHHALYVECRERGKHEASPTAGHHRLGRAAYLRPSLWLGAAIQ